MRTHQWMTAFLSGAILLLGSWKADAQSPFDPGFAGYTPVAAQVPEGFNPYPTISPYDNAFSETYYENGHWLFNSNNNTQYRYYAGVEALIARGAPPKSAKVGAGRNVITPWFDRGENAIDNDDLGRSPLPSFHNELFGGTGPYPASNTGFMFSPSMDGFQVRLGVESANGQIFEMSGMGIFPGHSHLVRGAPILRVGPKDGPPDAVIYIQDFIFRNPSDGLVGVSPGPGFDVRTDIVDLDAVGAFNPGVPVDDGSILGTVIRMDTYQRMTNRQEVHGAQASVLQMPSRQVGHFTVRPLFGVRYFNARQGFDLEGHDSGLDYEIKTEVDDEDALLIGGALDIDAIVRTPVRMYLTSDVDTHLGGAEVGWRYTAGGNSFKLEGETRLGVMGAQEKITVRSRGFGQPYLFNQPDEPAGNFNPFYDPDLQTVDTQQNAYVTPTVQQSINTTTRPFEYIPVFRSIPLFREANFKAGYTILAVLQMSRPESSIIYETGNGAIPPGFGPFFGTPEGDPSLIPRSKVDRSLWYVQYFNLGLEWVY
jgi:hypothetical protein